MTHYVYPDISVIFSPTPEWSARLQSTHPKARDTTAPLFFSIVMADQSIQAAEPLTCKVCLGIGSDLQIAGCGCTFHAVRLFVFIHSWRQKRHRLHRSAVHSFIRCIGGSLCLELLRQLRRAGGSMAGRVTAHCNVMFLIFVPWSWCVLLNGVTYSIDIA